MHSTHKKHTHTQHGFTIIETLVAVVMLAVVLMAVTTLLIRALTAIATSQDFFVASKIATEGVEMMRVKRNNNLIASTPDNGIVWNSDMLDGSYEFDSIDTAFLAPGSALPSAPATPSRFCISTDSPSAGRYTHIDSPACGGASTKPLAGNFTRTVTISNTTAYYMQVTVTITWDSPRSPYQLSTVLYNAS